MMYVPVIFDEEAKIHRQTHEAEELDEYISFTNDSQNPKT